MIMRIFVYTYAMAAALTFGWFANAPCPPHVLDDKCGTRGDAIFYGMYVSLAWPAYWPYEMFRGIRRGTHQQEPTK